MNAERTALRAGIHFIVPVWGGEYTRCFTEICLPTFLAPGNIPALPYPDRHVFQIYTTPKDRAAIEASPAYHQLVRHMRVNFYRVRVNEPTRHVNPLSIQSDCYRRAIRVADAADRAMFFMTPDMIIADGSLRNLAAIADRPNVRAIVSSGVRLVKEAVAEHLLAHHRAKDSAIAIAPRALMRLLIEHIHPMARSHFYRPDEGLDTISLSNLYWRAGNEGIVARCFHLHPFLIYPRVKNAPFSSTVDGDYIEVACPELSETYVSTDSDEFAVCELSAGSRTWEPMPRNTVLEKFLRWLRDSTTPRHRTFATMTIRLHAEPIDPAKWQPPEQEAGQAITTLLGRLRATGYAEAGADNGAGYVEAPKRYVPLLFATAIRSEAEARCFAEIAIPSLLAPVNVALQVNKKQCAHRIVATPAARAIIEASPALAELGEHIRIDIETRDGAAMRGEDFPADFRRETAAVAQAGGFAAVFIDPDTVLCDNALAIINVVLERKMRAMLVPRLRLRRASAMPLLRDRVIENVLSISPEDLVALALEHLHPYSIAQLRDGPGSCMDPATLMWAVGKEGAIVHAFDYDPVMIYPRHRGSAPDAVDYPLLGALGFGANEISIVRDSKAFVQCQLSGENERAPSSLAGDAAAVAEWAVTHTGAFQRLLFRNEIRLLATGDLSPRWQEVAASASVEARRVLDQLAGQRQFKRA